MPGINHTTKFPIHLFEEHSSSLPLWWAARHSPRTLVYLDAHLDLQQLGEEQISALQSAGGAAQIKSLESPHHLNPSPRYAYGIENFLYAAQRLKLIRRLVWVVPAHIPRHYSGALLQYIQQMDGVTFDELCGFKSTGEGALRGRLLGLDITLCDYQTLGSLNIEPEYYLDIDIDYFVSVPDDRLWIDPETVISAILQQIGEPRLATISRAVGSGFTPLTMRFIGDYCAALLRKNRTDIDHFKRLYLALNCLDQKLTDKALSFAQQAIRAKPQCAASQFILSIVLQQAGRTKEAAKPRQRAIELEPAYGFDPARAASGFPNRHRQIDHAQIEALRAQLRPDSSAAARVALALLMAQQGALTPATQLFQSLQGDFRNHAPLALAIARGQLASETPERAKPLLDIAAKAQQTRTAANMLLGELTLHRGQTGLALKHYKLAGEFAPAWLLPLQQQLLCLKKLDGDPQQQQQLKRLIQSREHTLSALIQHPPKPPANSA